MPKLTGGCLCGAVRYEAEADPLFVGVCHCRNCQKASGTAFATAIGIPEAAMSVTGTLKSYQDRGDSGKAMARRFCPECGSSLFDVAEAVPDAVMVLAGTLDDPSWVKPAVEIYCDSAQPWVALGGGMQRFPKMIG